MIFDHSKKLVDKIRIISFGNPTPKPKKKFIHIHAPMFLLVKRQEFVGLGSLKRIHSPSHIKKLFKGGRLTRMVMLGCRYNKRNKIIKLGWQGTQRVENIIEASA